MIHVLHATITYFFNCQKLMIDNWIYNWLDHLSKSHDIFGVYPWFLP